MEKRVIFLCEASEKIGAGHVLRCIALAEEMRAQGWYCCFSAKKETYNFIPLLNDFYFMEIQEYLSHSDFYDWVVVDRYDQAAVRELPLFNRAKKIMVLDDHANRKHECDILIDPVLGRTKDAYADLVPSSCHLLMGPRYAILRKEIQENVIPCQIKRKKTSQIQHILVNFGGADQSDNILSTLKAIRETSFKGEVSVVSGFSKMNEDLTSQLRSIMTDNCLHLYNTTSMFDRIFEADLAIGSPAGSFFERCVLGLPSILYDIVPHQKVMSSVVRTLNYAGAIVVDDLSSSLIRTLEQCLSRSYSELSSSLDLICDTKGVHRIVKTMEKVLA